MSRPTPLPLPLAEPPELAPPLDADQLDPEPAGLFTPPPPPAPADDSTRWAR